MYRPGILLTGIVAGLPSWVSGQQSGWIEDQVNATMCSWQGLRSSLLRDTVYMDGGFLQWTPGMADGSYGVPTLDDNPLGVMYTLNFSVPFNSSTNISDILGTISKAPNGGAANNIAPNYYDGAMLANDDQFYLYGGLIRRTSALSPPGADEVLGYQAFQYGAEKESFRPGFIRGDLPDDLTRYIAFGGSANAPSENKAWYFGGYRSPSWGPIYQISGNDSTNPTNVSDSFITLDLKEQNSVNWSNTSLPDFIPSRANPSVVWVPVGEQGILVVLGGVSYPAYNNPDVESTNEAQSLRDSQGYMANVGVYDIAKDKWYSQPTIAGPPQLAMGCAVVAIAQDLSSYNIYYYGGYDGLHANQDFNDDVWILSLPAFMWMKVSSGKGSHGRAGHQCVMPYPDQMVVVGGSRATKGQGVDCLEGGLLQVYNLTEAKWQDSYDPDNWNNYGVPEMIHLMIGGDFSGGATMTTPTPTGWATPALASVFATTYPASKITTYYPYGSQGPVNGGRGSWNGGKGGTPSWVAPVLGVVLGLVFLTAIVVAILLYRRRKLWWKNRGGSQNPTDEHTHRIRSWLIGTGGEKAPTVTTEDPSSRFDELESHHGTPMRSVGYPLPSPGPQVTQYEMPENARFELMDTSQPLELSGDGLNYNDVITKYSQLHSPSTSSPFSTFKSPSLFTGTVSQEAPSSMNSSQPVGAGAGAGAAAAVAGGSIVGPQHRPDSPPLGNPGPSPRPAPSPLRSGIVSDMSRMSERDTSHLRNLSNVTVSSTSNTAPSLPPSPPAIQTAFGSLNTGNDGHAPPSPSSVIDGLDGVDYLDTYHGRGFVGPSVRGPSRGSNATRRSVFREHSDDLGDSPTHPHGR
ncbi:hypothetical protein GGS20DRAFT_12177 [Poronia punctata]|nr:hypothetical protein GGS20DRAFT_12177 [Poronia punctata]